MKSRYVVAGACGFIACVFLGYALAQVNPKTSALLGIVTASVGAIASSGRVRHRKHSKAQS